MAESTIKINISKDFLKGMEEYGNNIATNLAKRFRDELTKEYQYSIEYFYQSYTPLQYKRKWQLRNSFKPYYKNPHGYRAHGGIIILPDNMEDVHHDSNEEVLSTSLSGYHGRINRGIYTTPEIYDHIMKYRELLWANAEYFVDSSITNYTYGSYNFE